MEWALLVVGVLFLAGWELKKDIWPPACDPGTSVLVAHAYVLSMPLLGRENELVPFMNSAPAWFAEGGQAIGCMNSVGAALVKKGVLTSNQFSGHPAMAKFGGRMPPGLASLPGQVDSALNSYRADNIAMGEEFLWLSRVLPAAAQGNFTPIPLARRLVRWYANSGRVISNWPQPPVRSYAPPSTSQRRPWKHRSTTSLWLRATEAPDTAAPG